MKNIPIIIAPFTVLLILGGVIVWNEYNSPFPSLTIEGPTPEASSTPVQIADWRCLEEGEYADYPLAEGAAPELKLPGFPVEVFVRSRSTREILSSFKIDDVRENIHPIEIHPCGAYVIKELGSERDKGNPLPNYRNEIWEYDYIGQAKKIVVLNGYDTHGVFKNDYSTDFRVSPNEKYIVLIRGYGGKDDYALVIKDLDTLEDVYVLPYKEAPTQDIGIQTTLAMREWSTDGRYFWGSIDETAYTIRLFRIDMQTKKIDAYDPPGTVMVASPLNTARGLIPYIPGHEFLGIDVFMEEEKEARRAKGVGSELYLYNVFTKKSFFVDKTDEPLWYFRMRWLSDIELQYEMPDGTKKVYEVKG